METLLTILIPLVTSFSGYYFISISSSFRKIPLLLSLVFSILLGLTLVIFPLTFVGLLISNGFVITSKIIFGISVILAVVGVCRLFKTYRLLLKIRKLSFDFTVLLIIIYISIYLSLFILRPVTDSDVVDSYLPLARSIILSGHIPSYNYFDNRPFIIPPVGGPVYFAYYYAVSGNLESEAFRYINIPYFLGFLILTYYLLRKYFSIEMAELGVLVVLMTPLLEDLIFTAGLYPDFIFTFLFCLSFLLITEIISRRKEKSNISYILLGLVLAAALLFKYQSIFLYSIIFILCMSFFLKGWTRYILLIVVFMPYYLRFLENNAMSFQKPTGFTQLLFFFLILLTTFIFLRRKNILSKGVKISLFGLCLTSIISLSGFIFILRNILIFGGVIGTTSNYAWAVNQERIIGVLPESKLPTEAWSLFFASSLSLFWLIPKIIGFLNIYFMKKYILPLFVLATWYIYWVLFLGSLATKWLLPILPYLGLTILVGLNALLKDVNKVRRAVWLSVPLTLLSSKFLFWNLGVLIFGTKGIREAVSLISFPAQKSIYSNINHLLKKIIFILTARTEINSEDIILIFIIAFISWITIVMFEKLLGKLKFGLVIISLIITSYSYIFLAVSDGNLTAFTKNEQDLLFNYWGQSTHLVPYLKLSAKPEDRVVIFSIPTGLSYYTGLRVYNLQYGGGLSVFYPIYQETDMEEIRRFLIVQNIRFIAILEHGESKVRVENLKNKTRILDILGDGRYAKELIKPEGNNYWRLYEII